MNDQDKNKVVVIDVQMPFISMVTFMIKWAIATIPALLILWLILTILTGVLGGLTGGYMRGMMTTH